MEAMVYRMSTASVGTADLPAGSTPADRRSARVLAAAPGTRTWSPAVFYPLVTEHERVMWTHWLPTARLFERTPARSPSAVTQLLTRLQAPAEVLEEFHWTWTMDLFEAYEVRTPVRRDAWDPLLLGRRGGQ